ncbi:MAG: 2,3-bisphosphoglycerate-independent phosphoglycerate mutase [Planctomycetota bacterium]
MNRRPYMIMILDGFGLNDSTVGNAIKAAKTPTFDRLFADYPQVAISAHGTEVGIEPGLMGNSEVGHMNIGAGRVLKQDILRIGEALEDGRFFKRDAFVKAIEHIRSSGGRLHLFGLLSDGGVHSSDRHYEALIDFAKAQGLRGDQLCFHAFLDGRDTPPRSADTYLEALEKKLSSTGTGVISSVVGRYWAMDRDQRWERLQKGYRALVDGMGSPCASAREGLAAAYAAKQNDEFVEPRIIEGTPRIQDGDAIISFNFRSDRVRQITEAFVSDDFSGFKRRKLKDLYYATMTEYKAGYPAEIAFPKQKPELVFGEVLERAGLKQLRIAETEKYAHVTFFFNGGREAPFEGEDRILVASPKVATYDLQPEMSAPEVTDKVIAAIESGQYDFIIMNYANPDMVGHTGNMEAAIKAIEVVDHCVDRVSKSVLAAGGGILLTADHGNAEELIDEASGGTKTAHSTNLVPLLLIDDQLKAASLAKGGRLADVVPTAFAICGIEKPSAMTGRSLLQV